MSVSEFVRDLILEAVVPVYERETEHGDVAAPESMPIVDRQILSLLHRILARVLPEDANDVDGDLEYQLMRAKILEAGYTGEYWFETAGFRTELSNLDCARVLDILDLFRVITYSVDHLATEGTPVDEQLALRLEFHGFDHNDALEGHMASYVDFLMGDDRWTELKPQLERHDDGNSHMRMLDVYLRMLAEYRRIVESRERGAGRAKYHITLDELQRVSAAGIHPANRDNA